MATGCYGLLLSTEKRNGPKQQCQKLFFGANHSLQVFRISEFQVFGFDHDTGVCTAVVQSTPKTKKACIIAYIISGFQLFWEIMTQPVSIDKILVVNSWLRLQVALENPDFLEEEDRIHLSHNMRKFIPLLIYLSSAEKLISSFCMEQE